MSKNKIELFLEYAQDDFEPISSFYIKDTLNPKIWDGFEMDNELREKLVRIGTDFYEDTRLKAEILDIILVGSLCNYNWSEKYSDFDIHIIIDFKEVNEDEELVEQICDLSKKIWNMNNDILLKGFEVEVAIQDKKDIESTASTNRMGGLFSLQRNEWLKKPEKIDYIPNEKLIREKSKTIMMAVDDIVDNLNKGSFVSPKRLSKVWKKLKKIRKMGLEEGGGEFSTGNLVWKLLRRNGYIEKIIKLKSDIYKKQFEQ